MIRRTPRRVSPPTARGTGDDAAVEGPSPSAPCGPLCLMTGATRGLERLRYRGRRRGANNEGARAMAISTIAELIRSHGATLPDKVAVIAGDRQITYGELDARSSQVANALAAEGVGVQDH